jgi:hypothetical protein
MAYRTYHTISCETNGQEHDLTDFLVTDLSEISGYGEAQFMGQDDAKWYDCEQDMIELSAKHPLTIFRVDGDGDGPNDFWVRWFHGGKLIGLWTAPPFDVPEGFRPPTECVV